MHVQDPCGWMWCVSSFSIMFCESCIGFSNSIPNGLFPNCISSISDCISSRAGRFLTFLFSKQEITKELKTFLTVPNYYIQVWANCLICLYFGDIVLEENWSDLVKGWHIKKSCFSIVLTCLYIGALVLEQIDLILRKDDKCEKLSAAAWNWDLGGIVKTICQK